MDGRHDIALIAKPHIPAAGEALARAFVDDPLCVYTQPDVAARISQFGWFFTKQVREAATQNGVYTNVLDDGPIGVAVWTPPRFADKAPRAAADNDTHDMERCFGIEASRRFSTHRHVEHVREKCMRDPHWYLVLLGVLPGARRQGIGQALLEPVLQIADEQDLPCYLETFIVDNVRFYERRGFEVVDSGVEPVSAIGYWAMKRKPGARTASNAAS
jgi:ribosomal protein S18 acetylase RimI-like enzyme